MDYGFNQIEISGGDSWVLGSDVLKIVQGIKAVGGSWIRVEAAWQLMETSRGVYAFANMDRAVAYCNQVGLNVLFVVCPPLPNYGPTTMDFQNFCQALATRYGPMGVTSYEIYNEENSQFFFAGSVTQWVPWLKSAYVGIKAVLPGAASTVITGGTQACISSFFTTDAYEWIAGIYQAGGQNFFDAVGFHWYSFDNNFNYIAPTSSNIFYQEMLNVRTLMVAQGDSAKSVWMTEFGFPTPKVDYATAANYIKTQMTMMNSLTWIKRWFFYNYRNSGTDTSNDNNALGIVDFNFNPKPFVLALFSALTGGVQARFSGSGSLSATAKARIPANFTGSGALSGPYTAIHHAAANFTGSGSLDVPIFGRPPADFTGSGALSAQAVASVSVAAGFTGSGALSAAISQSPQRTAAFSGSGTLSSMIAQQRSYSYVYTGTGTFKPTTLFTDFGLTAGYAQTTYVPSGMTYTVVGSQAQNPVTTIDGYYYTGAIYNLTQLTPDHYSEITVGTGPFSGDRSPMPLVRADATGDNWVGATVHWGGTNSSQIITCIGDTITFQTSGTAAIQPGDKLRLVADGSTYTLWQNGSPTDCVWMDTAGVFTGAANLHSGFAFQHVHSAADYGTYGVTVWSGVDLHPSSAPTSIAAALTGSGSLSAAIAPKIPAGFTGSGSLTATQFTIDNAAANLTGSGALSAITKISFSVSAGFTGSGSLSSVVGPIVSAAAAFTGSGSLTAVALPFGNVNANFTGSGALSATDVVTLAAALTGSGTLTSTATANLTAALSGSGSLTATALINDAANFAGSGSLSATVSVVIPTAVKPPTNINVAVTRAATR